MSYDSNGNTTSKSDFSGTTTYSWDFDNRLTSVTLPGQFGTVSFRYDRIRRRIYKSSSSGTSIYAYDGSNLAEETNASGAPVARYAQGLNIDQPLAMLRSGTVSYHEADGLGSVASLSNTAGVTASNYMYDSFGNLVATSGSVVNNFRYTGREFDTETGLYYYCAKYYDPVNGRFASEDPLKFFGGDINLCRYVWNHPTSLRDPRGLWGAGVVGSAGAFRGLGRVSKWWRDCDRGWSLFCGYVSPLGFTSGVLSRATHLAGGTVFLVLRTNVDLLPLLEVTGVLESVQVSELASC